MYVSVLLGYFPIRHGFQGHPDGERPELGECPVVVLPWPISLGSIKVAIK